MRSLNRTMSASLMIVVLALTAAAPASPGPSPHITSVQLSNNHAAARTGAVVSSRLSQVQYADISYNIAFSGFEANRTFPFAAGECPASLVIISAPADVFKCGWTQKGSEAILRLALSGTFNTSMLKVTFRDGAMTAPSAPGRYAVTVSGWSFDDVVSSVRVCPAAAGSGGMQSRGDVADC